MPTTLPTSLNRTLTILVAFALAMGAMVPMLTPAPTRAAAPPTELFFSEYIEGSSFNKALEIYNGTGAAVDLDAGNYSVFLWSNGGSTTQEVSLTGTIAAGDVFVLSRTDASSAITEETDQFAPLVVNFNGNDAVALRKAGTDIDVIGQFGPEPPAGFWGVDGSGVTTQDHTLRRKASVTAGDDDGSDAFDPAAEWEGFGANTFDGLGTHLLAAGGSVWINEIHYDNDSTDVGEFVEVAGTAGTDLTGWSLLLYRDSGTVYDTRDLSGTIPDQQNGFGTLSFGYPTNGIQNGPADGVALVNGTTLVQLLSYEGTLTATDGSAAGQTSVDIGVAEGGSTPIGLSLQLTDNGTTYDDFTWSGPIAETPGDINQGQSFGTITNQPIRLDCGNDVTTTAGEAATNDVTATDADGIVTDIFIDSVVPALTAGTIAITSLTPATATGGTASATVTVDADVPVGTYTVNMIASNADPQTDTCAFTVSVEAPLEIVPIGFIQGSVSDTDDGHEHRSAFAPSSPFDCSDEEFLVQGVVTQRIRTLTDEGEDNYGFFIQNTTATDDDDPTTSDGLFVFTSRFTTTFSDDPDVGGFYFPEVGDEILLQGHVAEFFNLTQFCNGGLLMVEELSDEDQLDEVAISEANPPDDLAEAARYWERHEGMYLTVPAGAEVTGPRDVFSSTADAEVWVVRGDHPVAQRTEPYTDRVFRDAHPLDNEPGLFDDGNGYRILFASHGLKWTLNDGEAMVAPARTFDTVTNEIGGAVYYSFGKYAIEAGTQLQLTHGEDPSLNAPPVAHDETAEYATAPYNVENLYDFRDDPFDGCDFVGNAGCPGVSPPFDYVPASEADYQAHIGALADQILNDLHAPEILMIQEAEDQDICAVVEGALDCDDGVDDRDGKPDTLQELGLAIASLGGPMYDAAYDRDGADDRGIVSGFLYRTDRVELLPADVDDPVLGSSPRIEYAGAALDYNADVQNPKALNAELPAGVEPGDSCDVEGVDCVFTRDPQVGHFRVWRDGIGASIFTDLYAISNHFSSGPDSRVEQRTEQAAYNAAIVAALQEADEDIRAVVGGDFNVFPEPDDPFAAPNESNQLAALYDLGLSSLWERVLAEAPSSAYSYVFEGQAQTLDNQFTTDALFADLNGVRYAHVNADWAADFVGDGSRGASDHDPQVARYDTLPTFERLRDLVGYYLDEGLIDPSKVDLLLERLDRAEGFYARGKTDAGDAQLVALGDQAQDLSPRWIDPVAAGALQAEALLLIETR